MGPEGPASGAELLKGALPCFHKTPCGVWAPGTASITENHIKTTGKRLPLRTECDCEQTELFTGRIWPLLPTTIG